MFRKLIYPTRGSLKPVQDVLTEAAELCDEKFLSNWKLDVPPAAGGAIGAAAGVGVGKGTLVVGAAAGTKGAAALTSGSAFAGHAVGAGMAAGIGIVAAPVAALGAVGYSVFRHKQKKQLVAEKKELLGEAEVRRKSVQDLRTKWLERNRALEDRLQGCLVRLDDAIKHLRDDLGERQPWAT